MAAARNKVLKKGEEKIFKNVFQDLEDYKIARSLNSRTFDQIIWLEEKNIFNDDIETKWAKKTHWSHDIEFGRQILNGINPGAIERCTILPGNFPVTNSDVLGLLSRGTTLAEQMKGGNIYIINHKILEGVDTGTFPMGVKKGKKLNMAVPMCLFYHNTKKHEFKPIAIQLQQYSTDGVTKVPIWTPKDNDPKNDKFDWLLAKMWFRHADFQVHQMKYHLSFTHLLVEPIAVATFLCLPPSHPIHKLVREHLQYVIAINVIGRQTLISKV